MGVLGGKYKDYDFRLWRLFIFLDYFLIITSIKHLKEKEKDMFKLSWQAETSYKITPMHCNPMSPFLSDFVDFSLSLNYP